MIRRGKWFSRGFQFDLPLEMFPNLIERLRGTPARLEDRTLPLSPEVLTRREGGSWSIQENVGHLLDLESLHHTRLEEYLRGAHVLTAADLQNRKTTNANHNATPLKDVLEGFRVERQRFVSALESLEEVDIRKTAMHPRLGQPMNMLDLAVFIAEHDDHHLARITELIHLFMPAGKRELVS